VNIQEQALTLQRKTATRLQRSKLSIIFFRPYILV